MNRSSSINRQNYSEIQTPKTIISEYSESENYCRHQLEISERMLPAERTAMLNQILESDLKIPQNSAREILSQVATATYDLHDADVMQINENIIKKFPQIAEGNSINEAANDLKSVAEIMLIATIIRPNEVTLYIQCELAAIAAKIENQLFAEYTFDTLINTYNLIQCDDINKLITAAASLIYLLPEEKQLKSLVQLYRALPEDPENRLAGLEAMMRQTDKIPETYDSFTVLSILNNEIYKLRLEQT